MSRTRSCSVERVYCSRFVDQVCVSMVSIYDTNEHSMYDRLVPLDPHLFLHFLVLCGLTGLARVPLFILLWRCFVVCRKQM